MSFNSIKSINIYENKNQCKEPDDFLSKKFIIPQKDYPGYDAFNINKENYDKGKETSILKSCQDRKDLQWTLPQPLFQKLDWKLSWKEQYDEIYGKLSQEISSQLWIPNNLIDAIVQQESSYWTWLDWNGSVGMMQLTKRPIKDMRWDNGKNIWVNKPTSQKYQDIYKSFDFEKIKNISIWNGSTLKDTLPNSIWEKLESIKNINNIKEFQNLMGEFLNIIKSPQWKQKHYYHTLNMIIWGVFFKSLLNKEKFDISHWEKKNQNNTAVHNALTNYNWNNALGKNGRRIKDSYTDSIMKNWKKHNI